jgi:hypothetical protein
MGQDSATVTLPLKPAYKTEACNGCGLCCMLTPCPPAKQLFGFDARQGCPALEWTDGRFVCGLLNSRNDWIGKRLFPTPEQIKSAIGAGKGCDCDRPAGQTVIDAFDPTKPISIKTAGGNRP